MRYISGFPFPIKAQLRASSTLSPSLSALITPKGLLVALAMVAGCTALPEAGVHPTTAAKNVAANGALSDLRTDIWEPELEPTLISVGDTLEVKFLYQPTFSDTGLVRTDGTISLPFLGPVKVADSSVGDVQDNIRSLYARLYKSISPASSRQYLIGIGDVIDVKLRDQPDLDETVTVRPDGKISLPLVHTVVAAGKTPEKLEAEINHIFNERLANKTDAVVIMRSTKHVEFVADGRTMTQPVYDLDKVMVAIRSHLPPRIYVGGEVSGPGIRDYTGPITALQIILASGGYLRTGELSSVTILRRGLHGQAQVIVRDLAADLAGGSATNDIALKPFDIVIVPKSRITQVQDFMDQYIYSIIRPLSNSSVGMGFSYAVNPQTAVTTKP